MRAGGGSAEELIALAPIESDRDHDQNQDNIYPWTGKL